MKQNEEKDPLTPWTGEQLKQSLLASVADKLPPDEWAQLAVRNPEYYHRLQDAQHLVRERKAPHAGSLGPYPDGALDRFFDAIEAGKTIDEHKQYENTEKSYS